MMMNPYELNWPGLRDVPVVTIDKEASIIYSQENLLPLKRGKLDRLECKYVPIEAVLDEFNAEIELEEAFETLESILDIPGVKPLYVDKPSGRKYVHVSSLLALIVLRPEDGPGFETACHSILHYLMNHLEMACLECGFIKRDCLCQVYDVCLDTKRLECVSYAKESSEKNVQTDPIQSNIATSMGSPMSGKATTVFLPPGANLSNCEQLPDGRLNIKYVKGDGKSEVVMQHPTPLSGMGPNMMLPPGSPYYPGTTTGFVPPVCHTGVHPAMVGPGGYMPMTTSPLSMMTTMLPTSTVPLRHMGPPMYSPGMYAGVRPFYPNSPVITSSPSLPFPSHLPQTATMAPPAQQSILKSNNVAKNNGNSDKGKPMKRSHEKQVEVSEEPKTLAVVSKRRKKTLIVPLKEGTDNDKADTKKKPGRKIVTLTKVSDDKDTKESEEKKETEESENNSDTTKGKDSDSNTSTENNNGNKNSENDSKSENAAEVSKDESKSESEKSKEGDDKEDKKEEPDTKDKVAAPSEDKGDKVMENDCVNEKKNDNAEKMDTLEPEKEEPEKGAPSGEVDKESFPLAEIKTEVDREDSSGCNVPEEMDTAVDSGSEDTKENSSLKVEDTVERVDLQKGWDVFEYAPTGHKMIRCLCCGQCFDHENYADKHNEMHIEMRSLRCLECDYTVSASRWYTLLRHLYSKHSQAFVSEENSCKLCGNVFSNIEELEEHVDVHHYNKYKCTYCGTSLLTWDAYKHHIEGCPQLAQGKIYYSCPYCHFAFRDRLMKQVHVKSHQDDMLVCCYCKDGKDWGNWKLLKNHYELLHLPKVKDRNPKKAKACPQCSQSFKSYKGFRNHVAKCTGPKKVVPEDKKEKENNASDNEEKAEAKTEETKKEPEEESPKEPKDLAEDSKETEDKVDEPEEKEKENKAEEETKVEEGTETNAVEKKPRRRKRGFLKQKGPYKCEKCHKKFGASSTLDRHMSYAHGPESKCDECDHVAKTPMLLKMHKTLKHSEKRHICGECNRTFMYYHQYKVHLAWHARKVAYSCPTCDAEFPRQMELRQHQLKDHPTGNNRTAFTCSSCDFKCFSRTTLRAHLRNKHLSSDEDEEKSEQEDDKSYKASDGSDSEHSGQDEKSDDSDSDSDSEIGEEDLQKLFSWRQSRPAPEGARRSQRTPKPSSKLVDIAKTRKVSKRKKHGPSRKPRRRRSSSPRRPVSPPPQSMGVRRRRPSSKGRPPKRIIKPRRIKKEKIEKKIKLRRCGCARFRTYAEFKILKKRMEEKKIVETTIVEDATLPMRRRTVSQESETEVRGPPKAEVPEVSWTYDTTLSSTALSAEQREQLFTIVLDHAYYQKPGPPPNELNGAQTVLSPTHSDQGISYAGPSETVTSTTDLRNTVTAAGSLKRKRLSSTGAAAVAGQSPSKVRATVNDLESAIKFADNINQLSKLVSILRADKEELPAASVASAAAATYLQSPPRTRLVPIANNAAATLVTQSHATPHRQSMSDYEIGDIEPLPSDIMASEMESDIDMQGVMSEILEEMRQGDNSGVSPDVSSAAEVLLSLDMSAEERELSSDTAQNGIQFTPSPGKKMPAVSVEYVNLRQNSQDDSEHTAEDTVSNTETVENSPEQSITEEHEVELVQLEETETETDPEQYAEYEPEAVEYVPEEPDVNRFVIKTVPLTNPKVAVEMTNVNMPQNDFLFWAAKHDDADEQQVEVAAVGESEDAVSDTREDTEQTTWQLDHQYF